MRFQLSLRLIQYHTEAKLQTKQAGPRHSLKEQVARERSRYLLLANHVCAFSSGAMTLELIGKIDSTPPSSSLLEHDRAAGLILQLVRGDELRRLRTGVSASGFQAYRESTSIVVWFRLGLPPPLAGYSPCVSGAWQQQLVVYGPTMPHER